MSNEKDELITAAELSRRIKKSKVHISKQKQNLKDAKCTYGKKFYYRKSALFLGCDPDNPQDSTQSHRQKEVAAKQTSKKTDKKVIIPKSDENWTVETPKVAMARLKKEFNESAEKAFGKQEDTDDEGDRAEVKDLLQQIKEAIDDPNTTLNRAKLDGLKLKASILTEYYKSLTEKIKNRKMEENLFDRDEVMHLLSFAVNMVRNSLINLPNNYAVNLEGMSKADIKDFVTDDVNKILEDFQKVGDQFD